MLQNTHGYITFPILVVFVLFFLSGCSYKTESNSHDILNSQENREVLHNFIDPRITYDYNLKFNGYIIGIEKSRGVGKYLSKCLNEDFERSHPSLCETVDSHSNSSWLPDFLEKRMILTHIVGFSSNEASRSSCILFNANSNIPKNSELVYCPNARINSESGRFDYMQEALGSIGLIKDDMRLKIEKINPTHIFLVSTGWNTPQGESIQNYNELFSNIVNANKDEERFVPLVVGFSWKSYIDNAVKGTFDVGVVGNDADEVGVFWAGPILHNVIEPLGAEYHIPVHLIGHSFGCRVVTQAMSMKSLYEETLSSSKPTLYGLQCAFSGNRFLSKSTDKRSEDDSLENFYEVSEKQFYTTSDNDKAVQKAAEIGIPYVGSKKFFKIAGEDSDFTKIFIRTTLKSPGVYEPLLECKSDKITLINASSVIDDQAPGTSEGGGSHSDVWDDEAGGLIWNLMHKCKVSE